MNRRAHHYGKDGPSAGENTLAAKMKVTLTPLHTLTPDMVASIARSHAKEGRARDALLVTLTAMVAARRENERG